MNRRVLVFFGGMSREHDISLMTGESVIANLPAAGWVPLPCHVHRNGTMSFPPADDLRSQVPAMGLADAVRYISDLAPDCVFIGLHGTFGEDGRVQSLCDLMALPYVGADSIGSAVGIDKWASKAVYLASGVPTPEGLMLRDAELDDRTAIANVRSQVGFPMVIKATREGSSFGVAIVRTHEVFEESLARVRQTSSMVIFERYKRGREFSVPVLEDPETGAARTLPIIEIVVHAAEFFDYSTKYDPLAADEICPAPIASDTAARLSAAALKAHGALMLSGYSRTDFIVEGDGAIWALETNTLPGMTDKSLFPKAAAAAGITYPELLDILIRRAINRAS